MNLKDYDLSKYDRKIQNILERLTALLDTGKVDLFKETENALWFTTVGISVPSFSALFMPEFGAVRITFDGLNGRYYKYVIGIHGTIFGWLNSNDNYVPLTEGTVFKNMRERLSEIENRRIVPSEI